VIFTSLPFQMSTGIPLSGSQSILWGFWLKFH
jgi:hypothetical protein